MVTITLFDGATRKVEATAGRIAQTAVGPVVTVLINRGAEGISLCGDVPVLRRVLTSILDQLDAAEKSEPAA